MLDELDALMERMLALPVTDLEENPGATVDARDRQHLAASLTILEPPPPPKPPELPPISPIGASGQSPLMRVDPSANPPVRGPRKQPVVPKLSDVDASVTEVAEEDMLPPVVVRRPPANAEDLPQVRRPFSLWYWQPLLWINQLYDRSTHTLGPVGQWLRSGRGRSVLGLAGLSFLGLAAVWLLRDWLGWKR
jgi:hypothetical protein